jgi:hypothetical protein
MFTGKRHSGGRFQAIERVWLLVVNSWDFTPKARERQGFASFLQLRFEFREKSAPCRVERIFIRS